MAITPQNTATYIDKITLPTGSTYPIVDYEARQTIDAISTTITSISSNVNTISSNLNTVSSNLNSVSGRVNSVSSTVNSLSSTVKNLATTITSVSSNLNSLSSTVNNMSKYTAFLGVVSNSAAWTKIQDGSTTATILVGSTTTTVTTGNIVIYKPSNSTSAAQEFIWDGSKWNFFGDISAQNLGSLATKNSASASQTLVTAIGIKAEQVNSTGSHTPSGAVNLTKAATSITMSSTTTQPASGSYWEYKPAGSLSITSNGIGSTSRAFLTGVTGRTVVSGISTTAATTATITGGISSYATVNNHILSLNYLLPTTVNAVSSVASATALQTVTKPTYYGGFNGTTIYAPSMSVTVVTGASFSGTAATVTVKTAKNVVTSVTSTTIGSITVS